MAHFSIRVLLKCFVLRNVALSELLTPSLVHTTHAYTNYDARGTGLLEDHPQVTVDVGAGKHWNFSPALKGPGMELIGFDIDLAEMSDNAVLDQKISGDACQSLGVADQSVDLVMGRAVIEHLHDNSAFLNAANRALRANGRLIVAFPSRNAPFAILNRLLPRKISQWLLLSLVPDSSGILGFEAFYDRTTFHDFKNLLQAAGFHVEEEYVSYFASSYYRFFTPLFLLSLVYGYFCYALDDPRLASYIMFVAKKG